MDFPQTGHHGKEVGNVYSIKVRDEKNQNRIFCWIIYLLSFKVEKLRFTRKEWQWKDYAYESNLWLDNIV